MNRLVIKSCDRCRKRKTHCSMDDPCKRCVQDGVSCTRTAEAENHAKKTRSKNAPPQLTLGQIVFDFVKYYFEKLYTHAPMHHQPSMTGEFLSRMPDYWIYSFAAFVAHFASRDVWYPYFPRPSETFARDLLATAQDLLTTDLSRLSIEVVQAYGFISRAMIAIGEYIPGAFTAGSMARMAVVLQLNWEPCETLTEVDFEVSRRTWWASFLTDRISSIGGRISYMINFTSCDRPFPVHDSFFHQHNFTYKMIESLQQPNSSPYKLHVEMIRILSEVTILSLKFSRKCAPINQEDRTERMSSAALFDNVFYAQWDSLYKNLIVPFASAYNFNFTEAEDRVLAHLRNGTPLSIDMQFELNILIHYHLAVLILHLPYYMSSLSPMPIVPWADHEKCPWIESAHVASRIGKCILQNAQTPSFIPVLFEMYMYASSLSHLIELTRINTQLSSSDLAVAPTNGQARMLMSLERENIIEMLGINFRAMLDVGRFWEVNVGFRKMLASRMQQFGLAVPKVERKLTDAVREAVIPSQNMQ